MVMRILSVSLFQLVSLINHEKDAAGFAHLLTLLGVALGCRAGDALQRSSNPFRHEPSHGADDEEVSHRGQQRAWDDVEKIRIQDEINEDGRWVGHEIAVVGEVVGGGLDPEEQDRGFALGSIILEVLRCWGILRERSGI